MKLLSRVNGTARYFMFYAGVVLLAGALAGFANQRFVLALGALLAGTGNVWMARTAPYLLLHPRWVARRWFKRRFGRTLSDEEARAYAALFEQPERTEALLAAFAPRDDLSQLQHMANVVRHDAGKPVPFPEVARLVLQYRRQKEERERHEQRSRQEQAHDRNQQRSAPPPPPSPPQDVQVALSVLGLTGMPATHKELRFAWRRRLTQYHPDKYAQESAHVQQLATDMTRQANDAYRALCRLHGWTA
jgi:hypothetical protein